MKYEEFSGAIASSVSVAGNQSVSWYERFGKRAFDVCFAMLLLPILAPVIALLWLIARTDGGPGFFGHERVGKDGVMFRCWKIRSMSFDAKERLAELLAADPAARAEWERDQKLENDPRITSFGRFIRRTSLDELPQIINVLNGDMSFVGPRPIVEEELNRYGSAKGKYLSVKPGVTGLWQVSGRNECSYAERVQLDVKYCDAVSPTSDLSIIWLTVGTIVARTGK